MSEAERQCRLYLVLPGTPSAPLEAVLHRVLNETDVACVLMTGPFAAKVSDWQTRMRELTLKRDVALLVENDVAFAKALDADGVHIPPETALYRQAREDLGERAVVGIGCLDSRHEAMTLAELGADYVTFCDEGSEQLADKLAWWSEVFVVPCVAWNVRSADEAKLYAEAGADFVAPAASILESKNAAAEILLFDHALRKARRAA